MKKMISLVAAAVLFTATVNAQSKTTHQSSSDTTQRVQVVEAACGECQFAMQGKDCELAVRIDGKPYFVDGTAIDDHGDAHAADGFCQAIRKAEIKGKVVDGRFKATYFKLLPKQE